MKKQIFLLIAVLFSSAMYSQIGINTNLPDTSAALDITSTDKGLLIPQMNTNQKNLIAVNSTREGLMVYDTDLNCVSIYTYLTSVTPATWGWTCLTSPNSAFFYMPSINIDTSVTTTPTPGNNVKLNLYDRYKSQFGTSAYKSPSAINLDTYDASDLYYYVTYYDPSVIQVNSISATGEMDYYVVGNANYDTYMNVVFVVK